MATNLLKADSRLCVIPVIYFSANSDIRQLAATAGADNVLAKPFDLEELEEVINNTLKTHLSACCKFCFYDIMLTTPLSSEILFLKGGGQTGN